MARKKDALYTPFSTLITIFVSGNETSPPMHRRKFLYTLFFGVLISISIYFGMQFHRNHKAQLLYESSNLYAHIPPQPEMIIWHTSPKKATTASHLSQRWAATISPYTMAKELYHMAAIFDILEKKELAREAAIALYPTESDEAIWIACIALKPKAKGVIEQAFAEITHDTFAPLREKEGEVEMVHYSLPSGNILSTCYYRGVMIAAIQPWLLWQALEPLENEDATTLTYEELSSETKGGLLELSIHSRGGKWHNYALSNQGYKLDNLTSSLEITPSNTNKDRRLQLSLYSHFDKGKSSKDETLNNLISQYATGRYEVIYKENYKGVRVALQPQANAERKLARIEKQMRWGLQQGFNTPLLPSFCTISEPCSLDLVGDWVEVTPTATTLPWQTRGDNTTYTYLEGSYPLPPLAIEEVGQLLPPPLLSPLWRAPLKEATFRYTVK